MEGHRWVVREREKRSRVGVGGRLGRLVTETGSGTTSQRSGQRVREHSTSRHTFRQTRWTLVPLLAL